jgi:hypothetical protein
MPKTEVHLGNAGTDIQPAPVFRGDDEYLPLSIPVNIRFPRPGRYSVRIWFLQAAAPDVLKMDQSFFVREQAR